MKKCNFFKLPIGTKFKYKEDNLLIWTKIASELGQCEYTCKCKIVTPSRVEVYIEHDLMLKFKKESMSI